MLKGVFDIVLGSKRNSSEIVVLVPLKTEPQRITAAGEAVDKQATSSQKKRTSAGLMSTVIYEGEKPKISEVDLGISIPGQPTVPVGPEIPGAAVGAEEAEGYRGYAFAFEVRNNEKEVKAGN